MPGSITVKLRLPYLVFTIERDDNIAVRAANQTSSFLRGEDNRRPSVAFLGAITAGGQSFTSKLAVRRK